MGTQRTLSIIKPDATRRNITGKINSYIEAAGLKIVAQKRMLVTKELAEQFYAIHKDRPFYEELTTMMSSAPVVVQVLEGENAVLKHREVMGATDPSKADKGTIRADFALSIGENSAHGSDSLENAQTEIAFFFSESEIVG